ncbi:MAG: hypothetical protein ACREX3_02930 [Gammaproteobacteria bacterium]
MTTRDEDEKIAALVNQVAKIRKDSESFALRVVGAVLLLLGIGLSVWSYISAKPGGSYVVTVGLIVAGVSMLWRSIARH